MGKNGAKKTSQAALAVAEAVAVLAPVGDVKSRPMFGGYGLFESGTMFALINSEGRLFFRVTPDTKERYERAGSRQHEPMPYFEVPVDVLDDDVRVIDWAREAVRTSRSAKSK